MAERIAPFIVRNPAFACITLHLYNRPKFRTMGNDSAPRASYSRNHHGMLRCFRFGPAVVAYQATHPQHLRSTRRVRRYNYNQDSISLPARLESLFRHDPVIALLYVPTEVGTQSPEHANTSDNTSRKGLPRQCSWKQACFRGVNGPYKVPKDESMLPNGDPSLPHSQAFFRNKGPGMLRTFSRGRPP